MPDTELEEADVVTVSVDEGPSKKRAKKSADQTFLTKYSETYPTLIASRKGPHHAHCTLCKSDFSVRSSGMFDCKRHCESRSHKQFAEAPNARAKQSTLSLSGFFPASQKQTSGIERATTKAEAMICQLKEKVLEFRLTRTFVSATPAVD
ncbi:hypothetical protein BaRGS_00025665 [Batillaria attramentaria]|uniref:Uncharacterized protein n=1 Tax=Batillaria attramentaria TaxID=370345 RepID=A0ABD0K6P3_9CAEN